MATAMWPPATRGSSTSPACHSLCGSRQIATRLSCPELAVDGTTDLTDTTPVCSRTGWPTLRQRTRLLLRLVSVAGLASIALRLRCPTGLQPGRKQYIYPARPVRTPRNHEG